MSENQFDFGAMVSAQMKTFRPGFKFPQSFNDLKSVEADPEKRKAAIKAAANEDETAEDTVKSSPLDKSLRGGTFGPATRNRRLREAPWSATRPHAST